MKGTALSGVPLKPSRVPLQNFRPYYSSGGERRASTVTCAAESVAAGHGSDRGSSANSAAYSDLPSSILRLSTVHLHESSGLHDLLEHRWKRYELNLHRKIPLVSQTFLPAPALTAYSDITHCFCSGAALYEMNLQRELAKREAQALQEFLLQQGERLQRLQLGHQQPKLQVRTCPVGPRSQACPVPLA